MLRFKYFFQALLLSTLLLLVNCDQGLQVNTLGSDVSLNINLASTYPLGGTGSLMGTCAPDGATVNLSSDGFSPSPVTAVCAQGSFNTEPVTFISTGAGGLTPTIVANITDASGTTVSQSVVANLDSCDPSNVASLASATAYNQFGSGTALDPYQWANITQLEDFETNGTADLDKSFILCTDIDASSPSADFQISGAFSGVLMGNAKKIFDRNTTTSALFSNLNSATIENLSIENFTANLSSAVAGGFLVGVAIDSTLQNITIEGGNLNSPGGSIGSLLGNADGAGVLQNISVTGVTVSGANANVGGVFGVVGDSGASTGYTVENILAQDMIVSQSASQSVGGISGRVSGASVLTNIRSLNGAISSSVVGVGGLIGNLTDNARLDNSMVSGPQITGTVSNTTGSAAGGAFGILSVNAVVESVVSDVVVSGVGTIGGIVGLVRDEWDANIATTGVKIYNSVSNGTVDGTSSNVGGLVGHVFGPIASSGVDVLTVENSEVNGAVGSLMLPNANVGGLIGLVSANTSITGSQVNAPSVSASGNRVGGFLGAIEGSNVEFTGAIISLSSSSANVVGGGRVGGFLGRSYNNLNLIIEDSFSTGTVEATTLSNVADAGGFVGRIDGSVLATDQTLIRRCYSEGASVTSDYRSGGFAGFLNNSTSGSLGSIVIEDSFTVSNVITNGVTGFAAGFVGHLTAGEASVSVKKSFTRSDVDSASNYSGGFVGFLTQGTPTVGKGKIEDSYAFSNSITSNLNWTGGFAGRIANGVIIDRSYAKSTINLLSMAQPRVGGFVGTIGQGVGANEGSTNVNNSFADVNLINATGIETDIFAGIVLSGNTLSANNYFNVASSCGPTATPCDGSVGGNAFTNGATSLATWLDPLVTEPFVTGAWAFNVVWEDRSATDQLPKLICPSAATADFCVKWDAAQN